MLLVEDDLEVALAPPGALLVAVTDLVRGLADGQVLLQLMGLISVEERTHVQRWELGLHPMHCWQIIAVARTYASIVTCLLPSA